MTPDEVEDTSPMVPVIKKAFKRYLRGTGHPFIDHCRDLISPDVLQREMADKGLRARRFVRVLSALDMMPVVKKSFTVSVYIAFVFRLSNDICFRCQFVKISKRKPSLMGITTCARRW